jgi:elongation factor Ts
LDVTVEEIKSLRERTGAGIMDCKRALEGSKGNIAKAEEILKEIGLAAAAKKSDRTTSEGLIQSYIHSGNRIGALVEVACETDFVARTTEMKELAHNLAMQVAAMSPVYISSADREPQEERPPEEVCLLQQTFIKDQSRKVEDIVQEVKAKVGENIRINRFSRFALGD